MNNPYQTLQPRSLSALEQDDIQRAFLTRVFVWMTVGLLVTALSALATLMVPSLLEMLLSNYWLFIGLLVLELVMVIVLSATIARLSPLVASLFFLAYAVLNGVTLSLLMVIFTGSSIALTFGIAACTFGIMALFGATTHRDLTKAGNLFIMGLLGIILASVVNIFLRNEAIYWIITYAGILIFIGLIAYDTQKLKKMSLEVNADGATAQKASIMGALALYLDFINLFLFLLRIFGRRR